MFWLIAEKALHALGSQFTPAIQKAALSAGAAGWSLLVAARNLEPDPVSAARILIRSPYWTETVLQDSLCTLSQAGFLEPSARRSFRLTPKGRALVNELYQAQTTVLQSLTPLPPEQLERLAWLLWQLVLSAMDAHEPRRKWALEHSRRIDPSYRFELSSSSAPAVVRIEQYLSDLSAFRDDCHMISWRYLGISGPAWETLTLLWRGQAATLEEILATTARRRSPIGTYPAALQELQRKGWLSARNGRLVLTEAGQVIRRESEEMTDRLFYLPWACLNEAETSELRARLEELIVGL